MVAAALRLAGTVRRHGFLTRQLMWRAFAARHAGSLLGWGWSLVSTAIQFGLLWAVFAGILGIRVADPPGVSFGVYLMAGLVPFLALNDGVTRAVGLFRSNAALVQRVRFPLEVLVIADTLGGVLHQLLALSVVVAICAAAGSLAPAALGWSAAGVGVLLLWIVGTALLVSTVGAFLPDLGQILGLALQLVFYAAPIVYPLTMVTHPGLRAVVEANPLTVMVAAIRAGLIGAAPPSAAALGLAAVGGAAVLVAGAAALDHWRMRIPDLVS